MWFRPLWFRDMLTNCKLEILAQWIKHKTEVSEFCMAGMGCYVIHLDKTILPLTDLIHIILSLCGANSFCYFVEVRPLWLSALHIQYYHNVDNGYPDCGYTMVPIINKTRNCFCGGTLGLLPVTHYVTGSRHNVLSMWLEGMWNYRCIRRCVYSVGLLTTPMHWYNTHITHTREFNRNFDNCGGIVEHLRFLVARTHWNLSNRMWTNT